MPKKEPRLTTLTIDRSQLDAMPELTVTDMFWGAGGSSPSLIEVRRGQRIHSIPVLDWLHKPVITPVAPARRKLRLDGFPA